MHLRKTKINKDALFPFDVVQEVPGRVNDILRISFT